MKQFYYVNSQGQRVGPVEKNQLAYAGIQPDTLVWSEGMPNWMRAADIVELSFLFNAYPPSQGQAPMPGAAPGWNPGMAPNPYQQQPPMVKPSSWLWLGICTTLLCCLPLGIVSLVYALKVDSSWNAGDYNGAVSNSEKAKMWGFISAGIGFVCTILAFIGGLLG